MPVDSRRGSVIAAPSAPDERPDEAAPTAPHRLARVFVELADTLAATFDVDEFLHLLCDRAAAVLAVDAAGVLVEDPGGQLGLLAASQDDAAALDLFELQAREGPCFAAYQDAEQVTAPDLSDEHERWPGFTPRALEAGYGAAFAFPLRHSGQCIGAMNLFRTTVGDLGAEECAVAQGLADLATIGLMSRRRLSVAEDRAAQLRAALDSRVVIEQAKGSLATSAGITPDEAFDRIRAHARSHRVTLRSTCEAVLSGALRL